MTTSPDGLEPQLGGQDNPITGREPELSGARGRIRSWLEAYAQRFSPSRWRELVMGTFDLPEGLPSGGERHWDIASRRQQVVTGPFEAGAPLDVWRMFKSIYRLVSANTRIIAVQRGELVEMAGSDPGVPLMDEHDPLWLAVPFSPRFHSIHFTPSRFAFKPVIVGIPHEPLVGEASYNADHDILVVWELPRVQDWWRRFVTAHSQLIYTCPDCGAYTAVCDRQRTGRPCSGCVHERSGPVF